MQPKRYNTKQINLTSEKLCRVGVVAFGLDVAKNPVISRVSGLYTF